MRILVVNEAMRGGGGVESYLASATAALQQRGHDIAVLYLNPAAERGPTRIVANETWSASIADEGIDAAMARLGAWRPDVVWSHNMRALDVDERLLGSGPVVKMMHAYFGTCVSGQKARGNGDLVPCDRVLGPACLLHYLPRRCGQRRPLQMVREYRWAARQHALLERYRAIVVASQHMRREFARHVSAGDRVHAIPLFATARPAAAPGTGEPIDVLFLGRMTRAKGGTMLVRAAAEAARALQRRVRLTMAGEGPQAPSLARLAASEGVDAHFPGWVSPEGRADLFSRAALIAVPSRWPEPFGLVGLEAAQHGVPAVAFDAGGVREWLRDRENGILVPHAGGAPALAAAIALILKSPGERARFSAGARRVAAALDVSRHVDALESVLSGAAAQRT